MAFKTHKKVQLGGSSGRQAGVSRTSRFQLRGSSLRGSILKWFKHFSNAHKGSVLHDLYREFGVNEGHGLYFRFIEYLSDKWDGRAEPRFRILESELRTFLKVSRKSLRSFAETFAKVPENTFTVSEDFCEIYLPKMLEIRHKDAISSGQRPANGPPPGPPRIEEEEEEERDTSDWLYKTHADLKKAISIADQSFFKKEYPDADWVDRQIELCFRHHSSDDSKRPRTKGTWMQKLQSWLEGGWQKKKAETKLKAVPETGGWAD